MRTLILPFYIFTDFQSRNPVKKTTSGDVYDEQYVTNILSEQVESNVKYGPLVVDQSQNVPERIETTEENLNDQSHRNRTFEENRDVKKKYEQAKSASNKSRQNAKTESSIRDLNSNSIPNSKLLKELSLFMNEMNRDYFH